MVHTCATQTYVTLLTWPQVDLSWLEQFLATGELPERIPPLDYPLSANIYLQERIHEAQKARTLQRNNSEQERQDRDGEVRRQASESEV